MRFEVGDAARIPASDAHFDGVFDFGIIHHVPDWRESIAELERSGIVIGRAAERFFGDFVIGVGERLAH